MRRERPPRLPLVLRERALGSHSPIPARVRYPNIILQRASEQKRKGRSAEDAADYGRDDGNPGVSPVVATLARYGQDRVRDAWPEVACWVDSVAGWPT